MDLNPLQAETDLLNAIVSLKSDPLGFVKFAYPWGEKIGPLAAYPGPQTWQQDQLGQLGLSIAAGRDKIQIATASGKGIGKSALVSWLGQWAVVTAPDTRGVITAGTEPQLRTKTMPEFAKWHQMLICKHWFKNPATSFYAADAAHEKTWRLDAIPWNANNPEAFAGLHNQGKRIIVIFDEASQIDEVIWNTTDGVMTDANTEVIWLAFGNPTRGKGRFFDCFHRLKHRWETKQIDSRTVEISDKAQLGEWVEDYGEDSDYVRVHVRGMFPRTSSMQFIDSEVVMNARAREARCALDDALILGVDVARFGDDETVIAPRKGLDARTVPWLFLRQADTQQVAAAVADYAAKYRADAIHVDEGGVGAGVVDRLRAMGVAVVGVQFGGRADRININSDATRYANKRAEMWGLMRESLKTGVAVPDDPDLENQMTGLLYGFRDARHGAEIILERKEHMKARGLPSPDRADALALTYAYPVLPRKDAGGPNALGAKPENQALVEYDPFA